jgi:hypothetical protein
MSAIDVWRALNMAIWDIWESSERRGSAENKDTLLKLRLEEIGWGFHHTTNVLSSCLSGPFGSDNLMYLYCLSISDVSKHTGLTDTQCAKRFAGTATTQLHTLDTFTSCIQILQTGVRLKVFWQSGRVIRECYVPQLGILCVLICTRLNKMPEIDREVSIQDSTRSWELPICIHTYLRTLSALGFANWDYCNLIASAWPDHTVDT